MNLWPGNEGYPPPLGRICGRGMRSLQTLLGVGEAGAALAWPLGNGVTTEGRGFREPPRRVMGPVHARHSPITATPRGRKVSPRRVQSTSHLGGRARNAQDTAIYAVFKGLWGQSTLEIVAGQDVRGCRRSQLQSKRKNAFRAAPCC